MIEAYDSDGGVGELEAANAAEDLWCQMRLWRPPTLLRTFDTRHHSVSAVRGGARD